MRLIVVFETIAKNHAPLLQAPARGQRLAGGSPRLVVRGERPSTINAKFDEHELQLVAGMQPGAVGWCTDSDDLLASDANDTRSTRRAKPGDQRHYYAGVL